MAWYWACIAVPTAHGIYRWFAYGDALMLNCVAAGALAGWLFAKAVTRAIKGHR